MFSFFDQRNVRKKNPQNSNQREKKKLFFPLHHVVGIDGTKRYT